MPYAYVHVDAEPFMEYRGVTVYHTYKNDDYESGTVDGWYGLTPDCMFIDRNVFSLYDVVQSLGPQWKDAPAGEILKRAIDLALEGRPEAAGQEFLRSWRHREWCARVPDRR